ncbi:uncharacterized protein L3040_003344 [Drepanopeziza brunnea f. sp. 'multigermtubi']|uniref:uncharacterized protein n=1 Tax=Drepanopeziza brunnea f. sp. 'multigermtubi' TaxID=698441 RepID=UPI0023987E02|nr:hypothetical protein L3040_003344 [Drepanopeziza brunnea f. sp. 'multigermtubi']
MPIRQAVSLESIPPAPPLSAKGRKILCLALIGIFGVFVLSWAASRHAENRIKHHGPPSRGAVVQSRQLVVPVAHVSAGRCKMNIAGVERVMETDSDEHRPRSPLKWTNHRGPPNHHPGGDTKGLLVHSEATSKFRRSVVDEHHYIPPYWRSTSPDVTSEAGHFAAAPEPIHPIQYTIQSQNQTHPTSARTGRSILSIKNCRNATTGSERRQCESDHQASIILYSCIGVFGASVLLLGLLKCLMCFKARSKRPPPMTQEMRARLEQKSGTTSPATLGDSMASRVPDGSRHMTLDGANDEAWVVQPRGRWNPFRRWRSAPGQFSPTPQRRVPRIPTLKLPQPVFTTVRKFSGIGFDGLSLSYRPAARQRDADITRMKAEVTY